MSLASWLGSMTSGVLSRPRARKNASRQAPLEALESRTLLTGDSLTTATVVNLQDDLADDFTDEIGNEGNGNQDVDLYQVTLTKGKQLAVRAKDVTPRDQILGFVDRVTSVIDSGNASAGLGDARDYAVAAVDALDNGPQVRLAFNNLKWAAYGARHALRRGDIGSDLAADLSDSLTAPARNMAQNVHDYADGVGGTASKLKLSQEFLDAADAARDSNHFSAAISLYKYGGWSAHAAAVDVGEGDPSQALNSLIVTIRLFDADGNELKEVHGRGGITLGWVVESSGIYFVGISGNDNFYYDPNDPGSGNGGSTGCYEMSMWENDPPVITYATALVVDPVLNIWQISGNVLDENPAGVILIFEGALTGHSTFAEADGTFSYNAVVKPESGFEWVYITALDDVGHQSDPWEVYVGSSF